MLQLILAIFLGLACPMNTNTSTNDNGTTVTTLDTGGETGHVPPGDIPPPPPAGT